MSARVSIIDDDWRQQFLHDMERQIAEHGYFIQGVGATPPWMYTIGLSETGSAELIIVGMALRSAGGVINQLVAEVRAGSRDWPTPGTTLTGLLGDYKLRVVAVDASRADFDDWLLGAITRQHRRRGSGTVKALQLVWQDEGYSWTCAGTDEQPLLGDPWW